GVRPEDQQHGRRAELRGDRRSAPGRLQVARSRDAAQGARPMIRRRIVKAALAIAGAALLSGHSPYRQWYAYRGKHLIVVASVADAEASRLADALAARLAAELPESHAVSAQAKSAREVVQLLRSRQLPAAVLDMQTAGVAYAGRPPFEREGPLELRKLAEFERHLLVVLD